MSTQDNLLCFKCHQPGHFASACPNNRVAGTLQPYQQAGSYLEHMDRIRGYVEMWQDGTITVRRKREMIAAENMQWYGRPITRNGICLTSP